MRLDGYAERLPRQLSGGQQQRVALARALAIRPDVLLLDEPLSNLDAKLREEVRIEIRELQRQLGLTTIMVTHDQEEALTVADRLVVMADGEIRQIGSQRDLYERPTDRFVAGFVGRSTFLKGRVTAPGEFETAGGLRLQVPATSATGAASLVLRPERLQPRRCRTGWTIACPARWNSSPIWARCSSCTCACRRPIAWWCSLPTATMPAPAVGDGRRGRLASRRRNGFCRAIELNETEEWNMTSKLSRRHALGLGLGAVAMPAFLRGTAQAQGGRVVVGTWGGDYARLLAKNVEDPILKPKGFEVAQDQAADSPRRTKMVAEKRLPRGTSDIQGLSAAQMFEMNEAGVAETIDYSKLAERQEPHPVDEVSVRRRAHLFRQGRRLQSEADPQCAEELQGCASIRSTATRWASSTSSIST